MVTNNQIEKIKRFAIELDWNAAFNGKSKGNRHLFRVVKKAKDLAINQDVNISIIEAAAWLHDSNLEVTIEGDTLANKNKIKNFLKSIGVDNKEIKIIITCIESHDGKIPANTIEAKIVHDADTLDKMGSLGIIRETWKRSQLGWTTEKIVEHLKKHIKNRERRIYTEKAKKEAEQLNKNLDNFFKIINRQLKE